MRFVHGVYYTLVEGRLSREKRGNIVERLNSAQEPQLDRGEEDEGEDADDSCFQHAPIIHALARSVKG